MSAQEVMDEWDGHRDAVVTVKIAGMLVDVIRASYDTDRDKLVLELPDEDLVEALRKLFRRTPNIDQAAARTAGEGSEP